MRTDDQSPEDLGDRRQKVSAQEQRPGQSGFFVQKSFRQTIPYCFTSAIMSFSSQPTFMMTSCTLLQCLQWEIWEATRPYRHVAWHGFADGMY